MDLILKDARLPGDPARSVDIGISDGRIAVIEPDLAAEGETIDLGGRLVSPGFVETHIHLDKSCILDRCASRRGDLEEAIGEVAKAKKEFTAEDVYERGRRTVEKCLLQGTTHMRTHLEVDPAIGLRSFEGVMQLIEDYSWAIDIEICVFPQEGLLNYPGTDELMVEAMKRGAKVVGAAPYTDSDPHGQIDRVFEIAREFDADIDMHLDFGVDASELDLDHVCDLAERYGRGGRTAIGHVTKLAYVDARAARGGGRPPARRRRRADGAALDRPVPDGARPRPRPDARRDARPQAVAPRRELLALDEQRAEPVHAVRRLLAHAHGEPERQHLPCRRLGRHRRVLQHGHARARPG